MNSLWKLNTRSWKKMILSVFSFIISLYHFFTLKNRTLLSYSSGSYTTLRWNTSDFLVLILPSIYCLDWTLAKGHLVKQKTVILGCLVNQNEEKRGVINWFSHCILFPQDKDAVSCLFISVCEILYNAWLPHERNTFGGFLTMCNLVL